MLYDLGVLREIYEKNENLMEYMKKYNQLGNNTVEEIMISYDFQAGSYAKRFYEKPETRQEYLQRLIRIIVEKDITGTLLEAGVGEATSLVTILNNTGKNRFTDVYGFDVSWSRIKMAKEVGRNYGYDNVNFFTGDMMNMPLADNSFDLVYTVHAVEPNGGKEKEVLQELYRVCKKHLILLEPCYEYACQEAKDRMLRHGYVTNLYDTAKQLGYDIELYEIYGEMRNELNPTGIMIINKQSTEEYYNNQPCPFVCPISKRNMIRNDDSFYCADSMLAYPIIQSIPCLLPGNAVVATKYNS